MYFYVTQLSLAVLFGKMPHGWFGNSPKFNLYFSLAGKHYFVTSRDTIGLHLPGLLIWVEEVPAVNTKMRQATGGGIILFHK